MRKAPHLSVRPPPVANRLLAALPAKERARVIARCDPVELEFEQILVNPGEPMRHVYFPTTGFISLVTPMGGKDILEIALTGNEGMFGVSVALGASIQAPQVIWSDAAQVAATLALAGCAYAVLAVLPLVRTR